MRIGSIYNNNMFLNRDMMVSMMRLSSMKKINRASDNAAGLAIAEKLRAHYKGMDRATSNIKEMKDLVRIAEGGMDSIMSSLQRMRELTLKAGNAVYSDEERNAIQTEINQLKQSIDQTADMTQYNGMKLLDGNFRDKFVTVNANGAGQKISIDGMSAKSLGVDKLDVTKAGSMSGSLGAIDGAMREVLDSRAAVGALENRFDSSVRSGDKAYLDMLHAHSRIADMSYGDIGNALISLNTAKILNQYKAFAMSRQNQIAGSFLNLML